MLRERLGRNGAGLLGRLGLRRAGAEVAQDHDATLGNHLLCNLVHRRQHAADAPRRRVVGNRTVGDREMRFLDEAMATDLQKDILHPSGRPAVEGRIDQRLQDMSNFRPALAERLANRPGVLRAEHRTVGIVVNRNVFRPPPEQQGKPVRQQEADHHPQSRGPRPDRAKRRLGPVLRPDQLAHLPAAADEVDIVVEVITCLRCFHTFHGTPASRVRDGYRKPLGTAHRGVPKHDDRSLSKHLVHDRGRIETALERVAAIARACRIMLHLLARDDGVVSPCATGCSPAGRAGRAGRSGARPRARR